MAEDVVLFGLAFDGQGKGIELTGGALSDAVQSKQLCWAHLDANNEATSGWLQTQLSYLDGLIREALMAEETRPRFEEIDKGALIILRGVNLNEDADPEDMVSVRLWVGGERIISLQKRKMKAVYDVAQRLRDGKGPVNAGEFVTQLIMRVLARMEPTLAQLDDRMDDLEEQILDKPDIQLRSRIVSLRREAIILRRYIAPQRDAISRMRTAELPWLDGKVKRHLQEAYDRLSRYVEDLDAIRERSQIVQDELSTALADRLNKNMYILSVIAAVFLPLGFLTGLLGVNVGGIPGSENPDSFWQFCLFLVVLTGLQIGIFRKLKWF